MEVSLGNNLGNVKRIENLAGLQINQKIQQFSGNLDKAKKDLAEAKEAVSKPFERAAELAEKVARLEVVNSELSKNHIDEPDEPVYVSERPTEDVPEAAEPTRTEQPTMKLNVTVAMPAMAESVPQYEKPPLPQLDKPKPTYNKMRR